MRVVVILLLLGWPMSTSAAPLTFDFTAPHSTGGSITGWFTYERVQTPSAFNVSSLSPNATYLVSQWEFSLISMSGGILPDATFASDVSGNSLEFCVGNCLFSGGSTIRLTMLNADNLWLRLGFQSLDPTPLSSPPSSASEYGSFTQGAYRYDGTSVPVQIFTEGNLAQRVPLPSTFLLFLMGFLGLLISVASRRSRAQP